MTADERDTGSEAFASLQIESVRLDNFRGLDACEVELEPSLTLLVGRNNAGKSRILRALGLALGGLPADFDDITVGSDKPATIDVVVAPPAPVAEDAEEAFPDLLARRLNPGVAVTREEPFRERFAWRTTIRPSSDGFGARSDHHILVFETTSKGWVLPPNPSMITRDQRSLLAVDLIESRRDLVDELTRRGSAVRRVLSDLEIDDETRRNLEAQLEELGSLIVANSASLGAVESALENLEQLVGSIGKPALHPLPVKLEELTRSVAIDLDTGRGALPMRLHGSGARSLASLQVQGVLYDRRLGRDGPSLRPHPVTLIEEPEAHLHPQASAELSSLLGAIAGQVIVSTHSSHLVSAVEPRAIRVLQQREAGSRIIDLGPAKTDREATHRALRPSYHVAEMEKMKRLVERPFGEVLFASVIVMGDGATERAFLPIVIRHALGGLAHGVCVIDPESMGSDLAAAVVKFSKLVNMPWVLFSDTDAAGKAAASRLIADHGGTVDANIVWVTHEGSDGATEGGAIEQMLVKFDAQLCRDACLSVRPTLDPTEDALKMLKRLKGSVGASLARELVKKYPNPEVWPTPLRRLIDRLRGVL